jgi:segregation and condensation protein A
MKEESQEFKLNTNSNSELNSNKEKYLLPEDKIYSIATDKEIINWKSFLYDLIYKEGLDPWNIDLSILTKKYLEALNDIKKLDFDISGKFLTIAVFLLKTKSEDFLEKEIRGFEKEIIKGLEEEGFGDELENFENEDYMLENNLNNEENFENKKKKYSLKVRNPIARKRKVNIFDLINVLEKTLKQSQKRKENFLARNQGDVKYKGPLYEKKRKDLKEIIEELFEQIVEEIKGKNQAHINFHHLIKGTEHKMEVLDKFIPLLHLHNQSRVKLIQEKHFDHIKIHKID